MILISVKIIYKPDIMLQTRYSFAGMEEKFLFRVLQPHITRPAAGNASDDTKRMTESINEKRFGLTGRMRFTAKAKKGENAVSIKKNESKCEIFCFNNL